MTGSPHGDFECPFCAIANGQANARVVWSSESIIAFLPDVPAVEGHTLVVPRRHVRDIWSLESPMARELAEATRQVAKGVATAIGTGDLNIIQSNGAAAGQTVFHLHIHVVPRLSDDRMPELWPPDEKWAAHHLDDIATKLTEAIARTEQG